MKQEKINKYKYLLLGGLGGFGLVILILAAFFLYFMVAMESESGEINRKAAEARSKRTAETVGTITQIEIDARPGIDGGIFGAARFYVDGKEYSADVYFDAEHRGIGEGEQGKVCYEPSNPENYEFFLKGFKETCGQ